MSTWRLEPAVARAEQWGPEAGSAGHPRLTAGPSSQSRSPEMLGLVPSSSKTLFPTHPESHRLCDRNPGALTPPSLPRWPRATTFFLMASPLNYGRRPGWSSHAAPPRTPPRPAAPSLFTRSTWRDPLCSRTCHGGRVTERLYTRGPSVALDALSGAVLPPPPLSPPTPMLCSPHSHPGPCPSYSPPPPPPSKAFPPACWPPPP